ncbi:MAG: hypothetical protein E7001_04325 [Coriobacteriaceae bacterium]|nr:hypothetical protein [Coriobacteriaceae bacterium]
MRDHKGARIGAAILCLMLLVAPTVVYSVNPSLLQAAWSGDATSELALRALDGSAVIGGSGLVLLILLAVRRRHLA